MPRYIAMTSAAARATSLLCHPGARCRRSVCTGGGGGGSFDSFMDGLVVASEVPPVFSVTAHKPIFVDRPDSAAAQLREIASSKEIAVDTEGASFHRFIDRVYLLQLSTRDRTAIVDPLAVSAKTLAPLGATLENPSVETVFHDADYDLRLLQRDYGWHIRHIFDTRIAAQILGIRAFGLAALLERYFGVRLDKKHQRADWSMRPLPKDMLNYAAQDTMYLLDLRDRMRDELRQKGRLVWAEEEFARFPKAARWDRDPQFDSRLNAVKTVRDVVSQTLDMDRGVLCARDRMEAVARKNPKTREELAQIPELRRWQVELLGDGFVEALRRL